MENPFEEIEGRLNNIENLLLDLKHKPEFYQVKKENERLMTVKETAIFLNLTTSTIYTKVSQNEIPFLKRGKRLYFSNTELIDHLKQGRGKTLKEAEQEADAYLSNTKKRLKNG